MIALYCVAVSSPDAVAWLYTHTGVHIQHWLVSNRILLECSISFPVFTHVTGFVLQCGDPTATGTGGPGYEFDDELSGSEQYPAGTLAMANAGPGSNTNGSQFFIVLDENTENLGPNYTVFGKVDDAGLALAKKVEAAGNGPDGVAPAQEVTLESVTTS